MTKYKLINQKLGSLIVIFLILLATLKFTIDNDMHRSTNGSMPGWFAAYIGSAVTSMDYNRDGRVVYKKIFNYLNSKSFIDDSTIFNVRKIPNVASEGIYYFEGYDLGQIDYVKAAFHLFGYRISSLLYLYYLILTISVVLFYACFRNNNLAIVTLLIFVISHYAIVSAAPGLGHNVKVIYSARFISVLGILPLFHLLFSSQITKHSVFSFMAMIYQSIIIIWMYFIRSSTMWIFILVFILIAINLLFLIIKLYKNKFMPTITAGHSFRVFIYQNVKQLIPFMVLFFVFVLSNSWWFYTLDKGYKAKGNGMHPKWHNIYIGMAIDPKIRMSYTNERDHFTLGKQEIDRICDWNLIQKNKKDGDIIKYYLKEFICTIPYSNLEQIVALKGIFYSYEPKDQDGYSAAFKWIKEHPEDGVLFDLVEPNTDFYNNFSWFKTHGSLYEPEVISNHLGSNRVRKFDWRSDYRWNRADKILSKVVKSVIISNTFEIAKLTFLVKPVRFLLIYFIYYMTFGNILYVILGVLMLCYLVTLLRNIPKADISTLIIVLSVPFVFSMSVCIISYPSFVSMSDQALLFTMLIYGMILLYFYKKHKVSYP
jgi:hypothetical protein